MKIEIHNMGAIRQAEIDLKPMTIFIAPNNTGKTWTAYMLSYILGQYAVDQYCKACASGDISKDYPLMGTALSKIAKDGSATLDLADLAKKYGEKYINSIAKFAKNGMQEFMGTRQASFDNLKVHLNYELSEEEFLEHIRLIPFEKKLVIGQQTKNPLLNALKEKGETILHFYSPSKTSVLNELPLRAVKEFLAETIFGLFHSAFNKSNYPYLYIFPTERTSYATFSLNSLDFSSTLEKEIQQREQGNNTKPESVMSFDRMLMDAFRGGSQLLRKEQAKTDSGIGIYTKLAKLLERIILGGKVDFSTPEPEPWRELLFQATENIRLDMPVVSSMVKELSPLVLYLRYLAKPHERLIIDEPEMNLHPKAQVQLIELLAMLVNSGINVLITTHSPYIADHLVNLMKAAENKDKESIQEKFYLQSKEAFISKKDVSVYLFENGTAKSILDDDGLIDWETFGNISDEISDLFYKIQNL